MGVALVGAIPGILAAFFAGLVALKIRTPSGTSIGKQVEATQHVAIANHYTGARIAAKLGTDAVPPHTIPGDVATDVTPT